MNYPKVIFTYVDMSGKETTLSVDIMGCSPDCEMERICEVFTQFTNCIASTVASKYCDDEDECDEEDLEGMGYTD